MNCLFCHEPLKKKDETSALPNVTWIWWKWVCSEGHVHRIGTTDNEIDSYEVPVTLDDKTYSWIFYPRLGTDGFHSYIWSHAGPVKGFMHPIQVSPDNIKEKLRTILTFL